MEKHLSSFFKDSVQLYRGRLTVLMLGLCVLTFGLGISLECYQMLKNTLQQGTNLQNLTLSTKLRGAPRPLEGFTIEAITPYGKSVGMTKSNDGWTFGESRVPPVANLIIKLPTGMEIEGNRAEVKMAYSGKILHASLEDLGPITDATKPSNSQGRILRLQGLPQSSSIFSAGRNTINWGGDFRLLWNNVVKPLLCWLAPILILLHLITIKLKSAHLDRNPAKPIANNRVNGLDSLRGVAILLVFLYHGLFATFGIDNFEWSGWLRNFDAPLEFRLLTPLTIGWSGVAIFFVISGFCIHVSWVGSKESDWTGFAIRRAYRILPPYWLALAFFAFLFPPTRIDLTQTGEVTQWISHLALYHNLDRETFWGINGSFWSIAVEAQLYLIYPIIIALIARTSWFHALCLTCLFEVGIRTYSAMALCGIVGELPYFVSYGPFGYWFSWTVGAHVAHLHLNRLQNPWLRFPIALWPTAFVLSCFLKPLSPFGFLFAALSVAVYLSRMIGRNIGSVSKRSLLMRHLEALGACSYSFYLLHQPIMNRVPLLLQKHFPLLQDYPLVVYSFTIGIYPLIFAVSFLAYRTLELPAIEVGKHAIARFCNTPLLVWPSSK